MIVTICNITILILFLASAASAQGQVMDGDELRKLLNPSEREHYEHSKEIKSDEMHLLIKRRKEREAAEKAAREAAEKAAREAAAAQNKVESESGDDPTGENSKTGVQGLSGPSGNSVDIKASGASLAENGSDPAAGQSVAGDQKSGKKSGAKSKARKSQGSSAQRLGSRGGDRYIPPSLRAQKGKAKLGGFQTDSREKEKGPYFGIRMGTKIRGRLPQVTTNVEQNLTEIVIEQDVYGDFKTMPRYTKLFAKKSLNSGSNRLELLAVKGITPQGEEFTLKGIVLDINHSAGLVGAVSTDGKTVQRSVAAGVFGLGKDIAPILNNGTLIGAGVEAAARNVMEEKEDETDASLNKPQYIIYVNPQDIQIRVEATF